MTRKKNLPIIENVEITDLAAEGNAIARIENKVLFVPKAIPGDVVDVQITRKRTSYMEGFISSIKKPSPLRIEPFCKHFGICGGCTWQHLPYQEQLKWKQKQVIDNIHRIAKMEIVKTNDIIPSDDIRFYRNKLEYTFSDNKWLEKEKIESDVYIKEPGVGFHIPGMFDKVIDIDYCYHQADPSNQIRTQLKEFALKNELSFFNLRSKQGFLRNLIIRNTNSGECMVIVVFAENDKERIELVLGYLATQFQEIKSIMYVINTKVNDTIFDLEVHLYKGDDYITEIMDGLKFKIGPKSFFQPNFRQACKLYATARDFAGLTGKETVYDLYTGTGTIANYIAQQCEKVVGIENIVEAIDDARHNSMLNNISNTRFFAGDIKDVLVSGFIAENGKPDVIITDPPRAGMHQKVIEQILILEPERIVYVSCNPATQARDIGLLSGKYSLAEVQPVDMFPHTTHVENVALLLRTLD
jgi:23S rRNA (uracil1939-C5)-methyltransferase